MFISLDVIDRNPPSYLYEITDTEFVEAIWSTDVLNAIFRVYENRVGNFGASLAKFLVYWVQNDYDTELMDAYVSNNTVGHWGDWVERLSKYRNEIDKYLMLM